MRPAEASPCLSPLQEGPRCAATCPCTSVCSSSSSQWHPRLRSSPLPPRLSCTWLAWKKCGPSLASTSAWHFDVSSVIALGLRPLSLEGFDMKSRMGSQVYPMASDPGLKQSAGSLWDTITRESEAPSIGASSAMKHTFLPSYKHILGVLIELYQSTLPIIDFSSRLVQAFCTKIRARAAEEYFPRVFAQWRTTEMIQHL